MIYANHAGTSWPKPPSVVEAVEGALVAAPADSARVVEMTATAVASFLNLPHPERLLFTTGCTSALATAFADLAWEPGEVVVTISLEHHAVSGAVERLVTIEATGSPHAGNWSPDGSRLVFGFRTANSRDIGVATMESRPTPGWPAIATSPR